MCHVMTHVPGLVAWTFSWLTPDATRTGTSTSNRETETKTSHTNTKQKGPDVHGVVVGREKFLKTAHCQWVRVCWSLAYL